jgi:hypothetical protein
MADTVDSKVIFNGSKLYAIRLTNVSDSTGESAVVKVDVSALSAGPDRVNAPTKVKVREILYNIQGFSSVRLLWDATTDDEIAVLPAGNGYLDYTSVGGLVDPRSTGAVGDILLTTAGAAAGATYDITLILEKKV